MVGDCMDRLVYSQGKITVGIDIIFRGSDPFIRDVYEGNYFGL